MPTKANASRGANLRRAIAATAARMMAEDGIHDFAFAKRKAARQLGANERDVLPSNSEIETELRAWQNLFHNDELGERLFEMRRTALSLMRLLEAFHPYLIGATLDGTAGRYAEIEIELYPDSSKNVEIFLLNQAIPFRYREPRRPSTQPPEAMVSLDWEGLPCKITIHTTPPNSKQRRHGERARLHKVAALLDATRPGQEEQA